MSVDIYLHIGMNKTGTTAIQRYFSKNRNTLNKIGLLYPRTASSDNGAHYALSKAFGFHLARFDKKSLGNINKLKIKRGLEKELRDFSGDTVLFSSEMFVLNKDPILLKEFFSEYNVKIVVYLRRHDAWWESAYTQAVKTVALPPWKRGVWNYLKYQKKCNKDYGDYRYLVDRWADVFGKENVIIRPYETQQNEPDIVSDLLKSIGLSTLLNQIDVKVERRNESPSTLSVMLTDIYQRLNVPENVRSRLVTHALSLPSSDSSYSLFPPKLRRSLVEKYADDYEYIAREYLGREDGRLFYDPLPDLAEEWVKPTQPTPVTIAEETVRALIN